jgi:hypothetical protein
LLSQTDYRMFKNVSAKKGCVNGLPFNSWAASNTLLFPYTTHRTIALPTVKERNSFENCRETVNYVRVIENRLKDSGVELYT